MDDQKTEVDGVFNNVWDELGVRLHEDLSEPAKAHAHGKLPRAYPPLPSFGILYLSVRRATELIVRDMYERNRSPFDTLLTDTPGYAEKVAGMQESLTPTIRQHLLDAIGKGRLRAVSKVNTYRDFIEYGDQSQVSRSYIFYGDLVNWLINSGYENSRFLAAGPAFQEYERQELSLAKEVEFFIYKRREHPGANANEPGQPAVEVGDGYVDYLEDALHRSGDAVSELKQKLGLAPIVSDAGPLDSKERNSLLVLVDALLTKWSADIHDDPALVGKIALAMKNKPMNISEGTIRKCLDRVREMYFFKSAGKNSKRGLNLN